MLVGLYKTEYPKYQKERNDLYKLILSVNNIDYIELHIDEPDFWEKVKKVDLFLFRWAHVEDHHQLVSTILPIIENHHRIKCFPNLDTCWHYDDKIKQCYLLKSLGYPIVDSWIFWEKEHALEWAQDANYPAVFKLKKGAGSSNVILIKNKKEAIKIINKMFDEGIISSDRIPHTGKIKDESIENFLRYKADKYIFNKIRGHTPTTWQTEKNYVLFQKYLPNNSFDTRIRVIGNRASAVRRFVRKNDFRASGSGNWDLDYSKIDLKFVELALKISRELKFQSMGYDFLYDENGEPFICEISYNFPDYIELGYWDEKLNWHNLKFVPPFFHLVDALDFKDLIQPDLEIISHLLHVNLF